MINASVAHEHGNWEPVFQDGTPSSSGARQLAFPASSVNTGPPNPTCLDRLPQCFPRDKVAFLYLLSRKWNQGWGAWIIPYWTINPDYKSCRAPSLSLRGPVGGSESMSNRSM